MSQFIASGFCEHRACRRALTPRERQLGTECGKCAVGRLIERDEFNIARRLGPEYGLLDSTVRRLIRNRIEQIGMGFVRGKLTASQGGAA